MRDLAKRSSLFLSVIAALYGSHSAAAMTEGEMQELNQLRFQVKQLQLINKRQAGQLDQLDSRLNSLEVPGTEGAATQTRQPDKAAAQIASKTSEDIKKRSSTHPERRKLPAGRACAVFPPINPRVWFYLQPLRS